MNSRNNRPRFFNLLQIHLPITGWVSILHRVSGVFMVLLLPFLLYLFQISLSSTEGFARVMSIVAGWPGRLAMLLLLWLFVHHLFAGIRVLLIDMEWGSGIRVARRSAQWVIVMALVLVIAGGVV